MYLWLSLTITFPAALCAGTGEIVGGVKEVTELLRVSECDMGMEV